MAKKKKSSKKAAAVSTAVDDTEAMNATIPDADESDATSVEVAEVELPEAVPDVTTLDEVDIASADMAMPEPDSEDEDLGDVDYLNIDLKDDEPEKPDRATLAEADEYMTNIASLVEKQTSLTDDDIESLDGGDEVWLEIDGETIVGVHNFQCQSDLKWVKYEGKDEVLPGSTWKSGRVSAPTEELTPEGVKAAANGHIGQSYPVWKQLNVMREGNKKEIDKMGNFIDAVRAWTKESEPSIEDLHKIKP